MKIPSTCHKFFISLSLIFAMTVVVSAQPSNDDCSSPTILLASSDDSCNNIISGTTFSATQSNETTLCSAFSNDDDVWYIFTPSQTLEYFFEVSNTTTETYVNIYSGTCAGGLTTIGTYCFNSSNSANLTAGTSYMVQVYSLSHSEQTNFDL